MGGGDGEEEEDKQTKIADVVAKHRKGLQLCVWWGQPVRHPEHTTFLLHHGNYSSLKGYSTSG